MSKLVVCNEPQNCGTVKELEAEAARLTAENEKLRKLKLEYDERWITGKRENEDLKSRVATLSALIMKLRKGALS